MDITMEVVRIGCTSTTTIKSCKTFPALVLGIDIAGLELVTQVCIDHAIIHISHQKVGISNKLMARIKITCRCYC